VAVATIVVVGSVNVDLVTQVERLPAPGETVGGGRFGIHGGGKGANQAVAAARLGARVTFVGAVGDDEHGRRAREELDAEGIDTTLLSTLEGPTGVAMILVDAAGENLIAVATGVNAKVDRGFVRHAFLEHQPAHAVVLTSLEVPLEAVTTAARLAAERGWAFVLDPAPARPLPASLLAACDVVTPNETEVTQLGGAEAMLAGGAGAVVVTRGAAGADLYRPGMPPVHQPAFPVQVVDTTGAGDAFSGALTWALASGWPIERAVEVATAAGALATRRAGAREGMPAHQEIDVLLRSAGRSPLTA
jgi:ribokinase